MVAGIIFEDENVVDLVLMPDAACQTEAKNQKVDKKVPGIYLYELARLQRNPAPVSTDL